MRTKSPISLRNNPTDRKQSGGGSDRKRSDGESAPEGRRRKSPEQALASLMRLCARAERCESDARRLMRGWGVEADEAERIVARLLRDRFIDDSRYAEAFVREKVRLSGWGEYKIRAALARKGIDRERIEQALAATGRGDARERLRPLLERKAGSIRHKNTYELKAKLFRYGMSLGYGYETVAETVAEMIEDHEP